MEQEKLAVFGAPWNPSWYQKFRDFPCSHFMVIDQEQLLLANEHFVPDLLTTDPKYVSSFWRNRFEDWSKWGVLFSQQLFGHLWKAIQEDWLQRKTIGVSHDTGFALSKLCRARGLGFESLTPVFDPSVDFFNPRCVTPLQTNRLLQFVLPESRTYLPKRKSAYSRSGFKERDLPSFRGIRWEEFLWKNEPFGFHMRGEKIRAVSQGGEFSRANFDYLITGLNTILKRQGLMPIASPSAEDVDTPPMGIMKSPPETFWTNIH
jgi:hypothetical protein